MVGTEVGACCQGLYALTVRTNPRYDPHIHSGIYGGIRSLPELVPLVNKTALA